MSAEPARSDPRQIASNLRFMHSRVLSVPFDRSVEKTGRACSMPEKEH